MDNTETPDEQKDSEASTKDPKEQSPKIKKELSVVSLPHDNDLPYQGLFRLKC